jgi:hypothetical protein
LAKFLRLFLGGSKHGQIEVLSGDRIFGTQPTIEFMVPQPIDFSFSPPSFGPVRMDTDVYQQAVYAFENQGRRMMLHAYILTGDTPDKHLQHVRQLVEWAKGNDCVE